MNHSPGGYYLAALASVILINLGMGWTLKDDLLRATHATATITAALQAQQTSWPAYLATQSTMLEKELNHLRQDNADLRTLTAFILQQHPQEATVYALTQRVEAVERASRQKAP